MPQSQSWTLKAFSFNALLIKRQSLPLPLIRRVLLGCILLLICQQLAVLTWRVLQPENPRSINISVKPAQAKEKPVISGEFTLFGRSPDVITPTAPDALNGDIPLSTLDISLTGILASEDGGQSIAIIAKDSQQYSCGEGDAVPGYEAKIVTIFADRVVLQYQGRYEALHLYRNDAESGDTGALSQSQAQEKTPQQLLSALDYFTISPVMEEEALKGYLLNPGKQPDLFYRAGLQDNDLAVALNGINLQDVEQAQQAVTQLPGMDEINLTVERDGQQQDIYLLLDGDD
ncbi:type II secretion system protein C (GspC)|uniref:Type II secretion system protein C (GspC) n=1 Tax=Brenneria salicis ATCC 15712 = DSM 30166 TaxID=714314 RepID=A0A366I970_9GAMM|nr:type II secretion system protein GspC [Brenneria salicis]NMN90997.1 type II secretion system protein C (GspC) [Brenneria salicis ATCC 15712 = DSM 30166]RBP66491.1 type II secretion system protein C (GspC) [Brenneria salicis ATCC 15712 = DSM 30166]RLM32056.1 type II secretion system protein GspC [Brenneria salicis ATCC 15712 = DSM 30166]